MVLVLKSSPIVFLQVLLWYWCYKATPKSFYRYCCGTGVVEKPESRSASIFVVLILWSSPKGVLLALLRYWCCKAARKSFDRCWEYSKF